MTNVGKYEQNYSRDGNLLPKVWLETIFILRTKHKQSIEPNAYNLCNCDATRHVITLCEYCNCLLLTEIVVITRRTVDTNHTKYEPFQYCNKREITNKLAHGDSPASLANEIERELPPLPNTPSRALPTLPVFESLADTSTSSKNLQGLFKSITTVTTFSWLRHFVEKTNCTQKCG
jgi:hypothetical protein